MEANLSDCIIVEFIETQPDTNEVHEGQPENFDAGLFFVRTSDLKMENKKMQEVVLDYFDFNYI